jgi:hypothetical protein
MATFTTDTFQEAAAAWAGQRNDSLKNNWVVKGGWEGWIQVDLVAFILSKDSSFEILREQPIYKAPRRKVDLLLNTNLPTKNQIAVEIKAESWENRMNPFINGIRNDIIKLTEDRNSNFKKCDCIMMAVPFNDESLLEVNNIEINDQPIFNTIYTGEVAVCCAVYKEAGGWLVANNQ